jgi:hypothetical protein
VVGTCQTIFRCFVLHVMPRNSGLNTTQENNFQAGWLETFLKNKFQKKCTKKFSTKTASDTSQNRFEKMCMPNWHTFLCFLCTYCTYRTKFVFCFLDNLNREKTNGIRMVFVCSCRKFTPDKFTPGTKLLCKCTRAAGAHRPYSLARRTSDPPARIVNDHTIPSSTPHVHTVPLPCNESKDD